MDLISNVFYRTHFDVYPTGEDQNAFGEITKYIISWCKYKAERYGITLDWNWSQFKKYGSSAISEYSHKEKGYCSTRQGEIISYEYAKELNL